jgi:predicted AAA+ superfamily ATPase
LILLKNIILGKKRTGAYNRTRGQRAEQRVVNELKSLGFTEVVSSRSESKATDDNKIDIIDKAQKLPFGLNIQVKHQIQTPQYFKIRSESTAPNETFVILWDKQEPREKNIITVGRCAIMDIDLFYKLIKPYAEGKDICKTQT